MVGRVWPRTRRIIPFLCLLVLLWVVLLNITFIQQTPHKSSQEIQDEILELSARYVKALAEETQNTIDGPYAGRLTGYDLKKTMAVLLESMMERMDTLEKRMDQVLNQTRNNRQPLPLHTEQQQRGQIEHIEPHYPPHVILTQKLQQAAEDHIAAGNKEVDERQQKVVDAKDLLLGAQEDCGLSEEQKQQYPDCMHKIEWMAGHWQSDKCYSEYGVDGSICSFRMYLSEVEHFCPLLHGQTLPNNTKADRPKAKLNLDLDELLKKLQDPGQRPNYDWMRLRITRMWPNWVTAAKELAKKQDMSAREQKVVLVHLGLLSSKAGFYIAEGSFKGGPLGELVQWSDIISALYILGHKLTITSEVEQLSAIVGKFPTAQSQCQSRDRLPIDMLFTDIVGLTQFKRKVRGGLAKFSCLLRIIDSFGTEPQFNFADYTKRKRLKTQWGMQNLNPQQFYTMFPHSPDNSFMGFVVEQHLSAAELNETTERKNQAVVYGKAEYMWREKDQFLAIIHKQGLDIHGTVFIEDGADSIIPRFVHNHGILPGPELHRLLRQSKLFIGLGFPYEGPAPLEAIAQGNVFINPKFDIPHNRDNTAFFKGKPTARALTSQHPYVGDFIGEPHVFTVDVTDTKALTNVIKKAIQAIDDGKVKPFMPYEFQSEGMLQRLSAYLAHQDFCDSNPAPWPPTSDISVHLADSGVSCANSCRRRDLICAPTHFSRINSADALEKMGGMQCSADEVKTVEDIYFPAYNTDEKFCLLQAHPLLFSCVGESIEYRRLCPCRTYIPGQTALCKNCL